MIHADLDRRKLFPPPIDRRRRRPRGWSSTSEVRAEDFLDEETASRVTTLGVEDGRHLDDVGETSAVSCAVARRRVASPRVDGDVVLGARGRPATQRR